MRVTPEGGPEASASLASPKHTTADCCLVSNNVATGVSLVGIRLLPSSTSDNIKFLRYGFTQAKCFC